MGKRPGDEVVILWYDFEILYVHDSGIFFYKSASFSREVIKITI